MGFPILVKWHLYIKPTTPRTRNAPLSNPVISQIHKKIRHRVRTIVSWPYPEQWLMIHVFYFMMMNRSRTNRWFGARVQYLQCQPTGDTAVLHQDIKIFSQLSKKGWVTGRTRLFSYYIVSLSSYHCRLLWKYWPYRVLKIPSQFSYMRNDGLCVFNYQSLELEGNLVRSRVVVQSYQIFWMTYMITTQCQKRGKYLQVRRINYCLALRSSRMFTGPFFQIKLYLLSTA